MVWMQSFFGALISRVYKKPMVLTQHNTFINYKKPAIRLLEKIADKIIARYSLNTAGRIIVVSEETKKYVLSIDNKLNNISVLYNGVDFKRFKPADSKEIIRKKLNLNYNNFICLTVRRITFKNGIDTFLETAKILSSKIKDIIFLLGGKGPDLTMVNNYILKTIFSNIKILGLYLMTICQSTILYRIFLYAF